MDRKGKGLQRSKSFSRENGGETQFILIKYK
jgi:hypothetical protein